MSNMHFNGRPANDVYIFVVGDGAEATNVSPNPQDQVEDTPNESNINIVSITIPRGRMRGDVNGDGKFTQDDAQFISEIVTNARPTPEADTEDFYVADIDNNSRINISDAGAILDLIAGRHKPGAAPEASGNWTSNPDYATEDAQFYTDVTIANMTAQSSAIIVVNDALSEEVNENYVRAVCMDGAIRIYAKRTPATPVNCVVVYGPGDGTAFVTQSLAGLNSVLKTLKESAKSDSWKITIASNKWATVTGGYRTKVTIPGIGSWASFDEEEINGDPNIFISTRFWSEVIDPSAFNLRVQKWENDVLYIMADSQPSNTIYCDVCVTKTTYKGQKSAIAD